MKRQTKPATLRIGSVSSGTLRAEDLLPAFLWEAERLRLSKSERATVREIRRILNDDTQSERYFSGAMQDADPNDDVNTLQDILSNHTPDYCYFGTLEGDGAEFGCWVDRERLEEDAQGTAPEVYKLSDVPPSPGLHEFWNAAGYLGGCPPYALHVNDHGNCVLYRKAGNRWVECWSIV